MNTRFQMYFPEKMDSTATWASDCCTGGAPATCYWNHDYPFVKTRYGFCFPEKLADSICQITVYTSKCWGNIFKIDSSFLKEIRNQVDEKSDPKYNSLSSLGLVDIGGQPFIRMEFKNVVKNYWVNPVQPFSECMELTTIVDSCWVTVSFECAGADCDGFIEKMQPYLETIRFAPIDTDSTE